MLTSGLVLAEGDPFAPGFGVVNELARNTGWLHAAVLAFANYGVVLFTVLLLVGWWIARRGGPRQAMAAIWAGVGTLLAVGVNQPLVNAVHEARPYTAEHGILVLAQRSADYSFPSDHAVMAGAAAAGLWLVSRRLGLLAAALAVLMAFSRVYIAAHYPHDVLAGLALGATVCLLGWVVARPLLLRLAQRLETTSLRPLLTAAPHPATRPAPPGVAAGGRLRTPDTGGSTSPTEADGEHG